ncbi:hypothetical protein [Clostridium sp. OS1-26]|uniref:hypothetical protein n=1 Tax=Clostridium sp. OS1-26 TaxID=3070681 RepID=UPI0027E12CBE|nr:hypothetical protein [Clostridium sp. OS1-26]WML33206.1 hypothetical protein RCG18_17865 [Clostridium sp. OS1-26]
MLVLRDWPEELYKACNALPYSESLYEKYKWEPVPDDNLERAVRFFYKMRLIFSSSQDRIDFNEL